MGSIIYYPRSYLAFGHGVWVTGHCVQSSVVRQPFRQFLSGRDPSSESKKRLRTGREFRTAAQCCTISGKR